MSAILHRKAGHLPPVVGRAEGLWVTGKDGRRYLDAVSGGAAVSVIGHGDARVREAILRQLDAVSYVHGSFFTTEPAEELAAHLVARAPGGLARAVFCSGGSEAVETALKLVRQYWVECGQPARGRIIA
ncbi:MAG: aminotransferase class III-fold pyridoxal phosphate-dependent enzyme, partial [Gemmatimonadales bacterium]|nr:aminotransferase class III-fold pyridoxal phosphate-dependent enzyme [Gemmatimonadales bacterium]